ncbi:MAG: hypothetical protein KC583_05230, partial [Myxococcales bacterium]|nr:hypothetical protein [Myxococcales bacterium]
LQGDGDADVPARRLSVQLPAAGAKLSGNTVPVRGTTAPGNKVFLNGEEVGVDAEGRFAGVATIDPATGAVEVRTEDPQGNRGVLRRPVTLPDSQWFLLAMGEGLTGAIDAELDGVEPHTRVEAGDAVYFHGRAVGHLKGWMKGDDVLGGVWKRYEVTANVDTARRRTYETYFRQLIDPETFYPVYGDSAEEVKDAHSRGPVYVLIKADASTLTVGNFKSAFRGVELFNYDRTLYGGAVALDEKRGDFRHEVKAFAADQDVSERHAYVELRGTGGSLYYLPHRELVEGSERLYLVERDRITGVERSRRSLARDLDYTVRYADGRVLMKSPVSSVTLDVFGEGPTLQPGGEVLDGHPVYLAVEYDHRDPRSDGDAAYGVHVRETWNDAVTLGGGYVREGRGDDGLPDYELWGAELRLKHKRRTRMEAEVAQSKSVNGQNLFSEDGGLTFQPFNDRDGANDEGTSFLLRGGLELDDLIGEGDRDQWYTEGYWQYIGAGFYSGGTIQQQGLEKYGGLTRYWIDEHHSVRLQFDGMTAEEPSTQANGVYRGFQRAVTRAGHTWQDGGLKVDTEFVHTEADEGDPDGIFVTDAIGSALTWQVDQQWTLLLEQEVVARGDERLHDSTGDLLTTTVGGRYRLTQALQIEATESLRWSGDNATMVGLRSEIDERHTTYVQERFTDRDGQKASTTVVGAEERFAGDKSGRAYGEYQLETGALGERNRAVLGVAKRTPITEGLIIDVGYERSQVVGGYGGEFSTDAVSLGVEWLDSDRVKITGRYELRYEDNDEAFARRDRMQAVALTGLSFKLHPDLTLLTRLNYAHTLDLELDATEAELIEGSLGLAWRPIHHDWVVVIGKYTKRFEQRPIDVAIQLPEREESDVVSLVPILELPLNLQLVEKLAYKRMAVRAPQLPTAVSHTVLWINRLNYHLTRTWDAGVEYRLLTTTLSQGTLQGTLLELNYIVQRHVRVGVGYNFTTFSDDEFSRLDEDHGGAFFRVIGQY